jgi:hypothetical protein
MSKYKQAMKVTGLSKETIKLFIKSLINKYLDGNNIKYHGKCGKDIIAVIEWYPNEMCACIKPAGIMLLSLNICSYKFLEKGFFKKRKEIELFNSVLYCTFLNPMGITFDPKFPNGKISNIEIDDAEQFNNIVSEFNKTDTKL